MKSIKMASVGKMLGSIRKKTAGGSTDAVVAHGLDNTVPEAAARNNVVCRPATVFAGSTG
jgi:hypothetical protein